MLAHLLLLICSPLSSKAQQQSYWVPTGKFPSWTIVYGTQAKTDYPGISIVNVDMEGTSAETITQLHAKGIRVICYFSAGTFESYRSDAGSFPKSVIGKTMADWPE